MNTFKFKLGGQLEPLFVQGHARSEKRTAARVAAQQVIASSGTETGAREWLQRGMIATALAAMLSTSHPLVASAKNVRVEDVENSSMQAGLMAANDGRFEEAERFFQIVLKEDQQSASAWSNIGNVHLSLGRPQDAIKEFTQAIALAPEAPVPYLNRALAREALGVQAAASGDANQAVSHFQAALKDCNGATERDAKEFAAWFNKGNIQVRLEDFEGALGSYTKAADLAPGISGYRLREAELMFQAGEAEKSDRLMKTVVRKNPNYAEAQAALAAVEWAKGRGESAEEHLDVAMRIEPRWDRMEYVRRVTRWPPALYDAMNRFLTMVQALISCGEL